MTDAIRMEAIELANGKVIKHPRGSFRAIAQTLLMRASDGNEAAVNTICDRLEGKPATVVAGDPFNPIAIHASVERGDAARLQVLDQLARIAERNRLIEGVVIEPENDEE